VRSIITAANTRRTEESDITSIRTIRLGSLRPVSKLNNDSDEEEFKERVDSADYSVGVQAARAITKDSHLQRKE
jgi:hypothetical protein